ncbi:MAG: exonuclease domain-containing protein [Cyclobacteriaceae bacterium]|nr:exonuclease domain-containing protein [Cyclobacteriaceae bacterium]
MYAIVDIETTGGYALHHRITDIAIILHDGVNILNHFQSLVNPQQKIPPHITGLTGITNEMVSSAPVFEEIADEIHGFLKNKIFVAHNVHFDFSFVKKEFETVGISYNPKKLCTVRLSRKIIPGFKSYSLGHLSENLGIEITGRHRAYGDAEATAKIFSILVEKDIENFISGSLKKGSKETKLPPNLSKQTFENLPEEPGIYFFHDTTGAVIYIGKAKNIKSRISGHFTGNTGTWSNENIRKEVHDISHQLTGNELMALLVESEEIKRIWPKYNKAQKQFTPQWALYSYYDQNEYLRLDLGKIRKNFPAIKTFVDQQEAFTYLKNIVKNFKLCPKLSGIQKNSDGCYDYPVGNCKGACKGEESPKNYNSRVQEALSSSELTGETFILTGKGRNETESSLILVEQGSYQGYGYILNNEQINSLEEAKHYIDTKQDSQYTRSLIYSFLEDPAFKVTHL